MRFLESADHQSDISTHPDPPSIPAMLMILHAKNAHGCAIGTTFGT